MCEENEWDEKKKKKNVLLSRVPGTYPLQQGMKRKKADISPFLESGSISSSSSQSKYYLAGRLILNFASYPVPRDLLVQQQKQR